MSRDASFEPVIEAAVYAWLWQRLRPQPDRHVCHRRRLAVQDSHVCCSLDAAKGRSWLDSDAYEYGGRLRHQRASQSEFYGRRGRERRGCCRRGAPAVLAGIACGASESEPAAAARAATSCAWTARKVSGEQRVAARVARAVRCWRCAVRPIEGLCCSDGSGCRRGGERGNPGRDRRSGERSHARDASRHQSTVGGTMRADVR